MRTRSGRSWPRVSAPRSSSSSVSVRCRPTLIVGGDARSPARARDDLARVRARSSSPWSTRSATSPATRSTRPSPWRSPSPARSRGTSSRLPRRPGASVRCSEPAIVGVLGKAVDRLGPRRRLLRSGRRGRRRFFAEAVGTFILAFVVFGAITARPHPAGRSGHRHGGVRAIIPVAPATGASINPARTFGPMIDQQIADGTVHWEQLPVYLAAEVIGAVAAGFLSALNAQPRPPRAQRNAPAETAATADHLPKEPSHEEAHQRPRGGAGRGPGRRRRRPPGS